MGVKTLRQNEVGSSHQETREAAAWRGGEREMGFKGHGGGVATAPKCSE